MSFISNIKDRSALVDYSTNPITLFSAFAAAVCIYINQLPDPIFPEDNPSRADCAAQVAPELINIASSGDGFFIQQTEIPERSMQQCFEKANQRAEYRKVQANRAFNVAIGALSLLGAYGIYSTFCRRKDRNLPQPKNAI